MRVLTFDPSGNYKEGEGTTGWSLWIDGELRDFGAIKSEEFAGQEEYWVEHGDLIRFIRPNILLMESYKLFANKSKAQHWSAMETPQLIGYLRMVAWECGIPVIFQDPADKARVTDPILVRQGLFELRGKKHYCLGRPTVIHMRDAIRHGVYFHKYGKGRALIAEHLEGSSDT